MRDINALFSEIQVFYERVLPLTSITATELKSLKALQAEVVWRRQLVLAEIRWFETIEELEKAKESLNSDTIRLANEERRKSYEQFKQKQESRVQEKEKKVAALSAQADGVKDLAVARAALKKASEYFEKFMQEENELNNNLEKKKILEERIPQLEEEEKEYSAELKKISNSPSFNNVKKLKKNIFRDLLIQINSQKRKPRTYENFRKEEDKTDLRIEVELYRELNVRLCALSFLSKKLSENETKNILNGLEILEIPRDFQSHILCYTEAILRHKSLEFAEYFIKSFDEKMLKSFMQAFYLKVVDDKLILAFLNAAFDCAKNLKEKKTDQKEPEHKKEKAIDVKGLRNDFYTIIRFIGYQKLALDQNAQDYAKLLQDIFDCQNPTENKDKVEEAIQIEESIASTSDNHNEVFSSYNDDEIESLCTSTSELMRSCLLGKVPSFYYESVGESSDREIFTKNCEEMKKILKGNNQSIFQNALASLLKDAVPKNWENLFLCLKRIIEEIYQDFADKKNDFNAISLRIQLEMLKVVMLGQREFSETLSLAFRDYLKIDFSLNNQLYLDMLHVYALHELSSLSFIEEKGEMLYEHHVFISIKNLLETINKAAHKKENINYLLNCISEANHICTSIEATGKTGSFVLYFYLQDVKKEMLSLIYHRFVNSEELPNKIYLEEFIKNLDVKAIYSSDSFLTWYSRGREKSYVSYLSSILDRIKEKIFAVVNAKPIQKPESRTEKMPSQTLKALYTELQTLLIKSREYQSNQTKVSIKNNKLYLKIIHELLERLELCKMEEEVLSQAYSISELNKNRYEFGEEEAELAILKIQTESSLTSRRELLNYHEQIQEETAIKSMEDREQDIKDRKSNLEKLTGDLSSVESESTDCENKITKLCSDNMAILKQSPRSDEQNALLRENVKAITELKSQKDSLTKKLEDLKKTLQSMQKAFEVVKDTFEIKLNQEKEKQANIDQIRKLEAIVRVYAEKLKHCREKIAVEERTLASTSEQYATSADNLRSKIQAYEHQHGVVAKNKKSKGKNKAKSTKKPAILTPLDIQIPTMSSTRMEIREFLKNLYVRMGLYEELLTSLIGLQLQNLEEDFTEDSLVELMSKIPPLRDMERLDDYLSYYILAFERCKNIKTAKRILDEFTKQIPEPFINALLLEQVNFYNLLKLSSVILTMVKSISKNISEEEEKTTEDIPEEAIQALLAFPKRICHSVLFYDEYQKEFNDLLDEIYRVEDTHIKVIIEKATFTFSSNNEIASYNISISELRDIYMYSLALVHRYYVYALKEIASDTMKDYWISNINVLKNIMKKIGLEELSASCETILKNFNLDNKENKLQLFKNFEALISYLMKNIGSDPALDGKTKLLLEITENILHNASKDDIFFETKKLEDCLNTYFDFYRNDNSSECFLLQELYKIFSELEFLTFHVPSNNNFIRTPSFDDNFNNILRLYNEILSFGRLSLSYWEEYLRKIDELFSCLSYTGESEYQYEDIIYSNRQNNYYCGVLKTALMSFLNLKKFLMKNNNSLGKNMVLFSEYEANIKADYEKCKHILLRSNQEYVVTSGERRNIISEYCSYLCEDIFDSILAINITQQNQEKAKKKKKTKTKNSKAGPLNKNGGSNVLAAASGAAPEGASAEGALPSASGAAPEGASAEGALPSASGIPPEGASAEGALASASGTPPDEEPTEDVLGTASGVPPEEEPPEGDLAPLSVTHNEEREEDTVTIEEERFVGTLPSDLDMVFDNTLLPEFPTSGAPEQEPEEVSLASAFVVLEEKPTEGVLATVSAAPDEEPEEHIATIEEERFVDPLPSIPATQDDEIADVNVDSVFTIPDEETLDVNLIPVPVISDDESEEETLPSVFEISEEELIPYRLENFSLSHLVDKEEKTEFEKFLSFVYHERPELYQQILAHVMKNFPAQIFDLTAFSFLEDITKRLLNFEVRLLNSAVSYFIQGREKQVPQHFSVGLTCSVMESPHVFIQITPQCYTDIVRILKNENIKVHHVRAFLFKEGEFIYYFKHQNLLMTNNTLKELSPKALYCEMNKYIETVVSPEQLFRENPFIVFDAVSWRAQGYRYHGNFKAGVEPFLRYLFVNNYYERGITWPVLYAQLLEHKPLGYSFWKELWNSGVMQMLLFDAKVKINVSDCFHYLENTAGKPHDPLFVLAVMWAFVSIKVWPNLCNRIPALAVLPGFLGSNSQAVFTATTIEVGRHSKWQPLNSLPQCSSTFFQRPGLPVVAEKDIKPSPSVSLGNRPS